MNEVIQKELASMNRDLVSIMARFRRIHDLFLDLTDDRPRPRKDINLSHTVGPDGELHAVNCPGCRTGASEPSHERLGSCYCPPGHGHVG